MVGFEQYPHAYQQQYGYAPEVKAESIEQHLIGYSFDLFSTPHEQYNNGQIDFKYEMFKTMSQNVMHQNQSETTPSILSSMSAPSLPSANSSTVGSPNSSHALPVSSQAMYINDYMLGPAIVDDSFSYVYESNDFDHEAFAANNKFGVHCVDPILVSDQRSSYLPTVYGNFSAPQQTNYSPAASPVPSAASYHSFSCPITVDNFPTQHAAMRRPSVSSLRSGGSPQSTSSQDEDREKDKCPFPDCGRTFKDLKAHLLTHGSERPEKCPIVSCEYHKKGFARKYDKNRHTLTHYRGTMICGFCPGSGSAAEKSFNRADVFKRHLTSVHGVEQTPPNSRKRSPARTHAKLSSYCPDATGKCSTCASTFNNAQEFYEHLDDCVLKIVQQEDPIEAVNAKRLGEVVNDTDVLATFERNHIKPEDETVNLYELDEDEDDEEEDGEEDEENEVNERSGRGVLRTTKVASSRPIIGGNICKKSAKKGMTWSKGGGSIIGKSRKRRKFYPPSWGMATDKMNMKKRVLCVYDGPRRLLKDDVMMHNEFEVRMPLLDGISYVTDLDVESMKRAEAFHDATPEEKGPWIHEQDY